jgi:membrane complex biogenesis BtpA family protein
MQIPFRAKALIGMVHVAALPGTPRHALSMTQIIDQAVGQAAALADAGFDALLIENMHDAPYLRRDVGPEIIAAITAVGAAVRAAVALPLGVQILAGANKAALAVAHAVGGQFIRAEGYVFASVADEGLLDEADAGPLLRYRRQIGADDIAVFSDIKKKHSSHALTADVDIAETARGAEFFGADGVIVTGCATGEPCDTGELAAVRSATKLPVLVGSGVTPETVAGLLEHADALIVGSFVKRDGLWSNPLDAGRAKKLAQAVQRARA